MVGSHVSRGALVITLALAPAAALIPSSTAVAHPATKNAGDSWSGKYNDFLSVDIIRRDSSRGKAEAVVTYTCSINGSYSTLQADITGKVDHNKIKLHGGTEDQTGTAHVRATLTKPKAKVTAIVKDSQGSCEVDGYDFKAKFKRIK